MEEGETHIPLETQINYGSNTKDSNTRKIYTPVVSTSQRKSGSSTKKYQPILFKMETTSGISAKETSTRKIYHPIPFKMETKSGSSVKKTSTTRKKYLPVPFSMRLREDISNSNRKRKCTSPVAKKVEKLPTFKKKLFEPTHTKIPKNDRPLSKNDELDETKEFAQLEEDFGAPSTNITCTSPVAKKVVKQLTFKKKLFEPTHTKILKYNRPALSKNNELDETKEFLQLEEDFGAPLTSINVLKVVNRLDKLAQDCKSIKEMLSGLTVKLPL